jgi:hypothetical protein
MKTCKYLSDDDQEICCNGDCPVCADFCPVVNYPTICVHYEERGENDEAEKSVNKTQSGL